MVEVLLATYNGGKYLGKQLNSLLKQDYNDFIVTIRDDGSDDNTLEVIDQYVTMYPQRFRLYKSVTKNRSTLKNFGELLAQATGEYVMFCDQDDVWRESKISRSMAQMKQMENQYGKSTAILVYGDAEVADSELKPISKSFAKYSGMNAKNLTIKKLLVENPIVSATCMVNGGLLTLLRKIPENAVSLSWWTALTAVCFGKTSYMNNPLMIYRSHEENSVASKKAGKGFGESDIKFSLQQSYWQADAFLAAHTSGLNEEKKQAIAEYAAFQTMGKGAKIGKILFGGYSRSGLDRTIMQVIHG